MRANRTFTTPTLYLRVGLTCLSSMFQPGFFNKHDRFAHNFEASFCYCHCNSPSGRFYSCKLLMENYKQRYFFVSHYNVKKRQLIYNYNFFHFSLILNPSKRTGLYSSMIHKYIGEFKTPKTMSVLSILDSIILTNCKYQNIVS